MEVDIGNSWGYATHDMYVRRWELIAPNITASEFVLVDWGSDAGWFSVKVAHDFPGSEVVSVEAGIMSDGAGIHLHRSKLAEFGIGNNTIVQSLFGPDTFRDLRTVRSDYQLVLSVFHHIGDGFGRYLRTEKEWDDAFAGLVLGSKTTFFEIPNEDSPSETPHRIRAWYKDRDVESVIRSALNRSNVSATVELLGETQHGAKGPRKLFKIDLQEPSESSDATQIARYIKMAGERSRIRTLRGLRFAASKLLRRMRPGSKPDVVRVNATE